LVIQDRRYLFDTPDDDSAVEIFFLQCLLKGQCINDTGGKFATGINDAGGKLPLVSMTPAANLPPVSLTPVANNGNKIRLQTP
jgi:hypothetical protein